MMVPALQMTFRFFNEKPLNGAFTLADKPVFSIENWMNGSFQSNTERYLKDHAGFRNFLVRLQNQLDYSIFKKANAEGAVIGKKRQLFEYDYIRAWLAIDYPGDDFARKKMLRLKFVQEYLKQEKGIDLILVFEPGKASFYPEYIPNQYASKKAGLSTYERFRSKADEMKVDFIDFHRYFIELKPKAEYPLFPQNGTHWSVYGMQFAADSLLNFIETRRNIRLTEVNTTSLEISNIPRDTDDDVLKTINTLFQVRGEVLAYPVLSFDTLHPGEKPHVLVIADSYYWNIFNTRIPKYIFANQAFWYFNSLVYPDYYYKPTYTKDLQFQAEIEKQQVIFLMVTERFVHKFDWKFIDQIFDLYAPDWLNDPVYNNINNIMQVESWYNDIIKKSEKKHMSLDLCLLDEARYLYLKNDTSGYFIDYGIEHFMKVISQDSAWSAFISDKARKENREYNEELYINAEYVFQKEYPVLFEISRGISLNRQKLVSDPVTLDRLKHEAESHYWDIDRYLRKKSWEMFKDEEMMKTREAILKDRNWLDDVKQKATRKGITLDEMITLDAIYLFKNKYGHFEL
jgi:hypothetical protein